MGIAWAAIHDIRTRIMHLRHFLNIHESNADFDVLPLKVIFSRRNPSCTDRGRQSQTEIAQKCAFWCVTFPKIGHPVTSGRIQNCGRIYGYRFRPKDHHGNQSMSTKENRTAAKAMQVMIGQLDVSYP